MIRDRLASLGRPIPVLAALEGPLQRRLLVGGLWSLAGALFARASTLVLGIFVARLLGKEGFGALGMVQSTVGLFAIFAGFSLGLTATKYIAELRDHDRQRTGRVLALSWGTAVAAGGVLSVGLALGANLLATETLSTPELGRPLRIGAVLLFLSSLNGAQSGALAGFEAFRAQARVNLLGGAVALVAGIAGVLRWGLEGALWGQAVGLLATALAGHIAVRAACSVYGVRIAYTGCLIEWPLLVRFSAPALLSAMATMPVTWITSAMLVHAPGGLAEMGLFNAAGHWRQFLLFVPNVIGAFITPILAERYARGGAGSAGATLRAAMLAAAAIVIPAGLLLLLAGPWILAAYGPAFADGWSTLSVVIVTAVLMSVQAPVGSAIAAAGRMWAGAAMNGGWAVVMLAGAWLLRSKGALGLALAYLSAYAVHAIWTFAFARRVIGRGREAGAPTLRRAPLDMGRSDGGPAGAMVGETPSGPRWRGRE